jgi:hypothetical protein
LFDEQAGKLFSSTHQIIRPAKSRLGNIKFFEGEEQMMAHHERESVPPARVSGGRECRRQPEPSDIGNKGAPKAATTRSLRGCSHCTPWRQFAREIIRGGYRLIGKESPTSATYRNWARRCKSRIRRSVHRSGGGFYLPRKAAAQGNCCLLCNRGR